MTTTVNDRSLSGNDIGVYLSLQTVKGVINTNPVFSQFRRTEGKASETIAYTTSSEVKSNRQARQQIQESSTNAAELSFELNQQTAPYLDALIHGTKADNSYTASTIASDANGFNDSANGFTNLSVGDWIQVSGFATASINGFYKISAKASNGDIETTVAPAAVEAEGQAVTFSSMKTASGSAQCYFTVQNRTVDNSAADDIAYDTFFDGIINTGGFEIAETGIVTGTFALNIESKSAGTAAIAGQTDAAADTSQVIGSGGGGLSSIYVDGADSECEVKSMGLEFNNNYQGDRSAACEGERYAFGDVETTGALVTRAVISNTFDWRNRFSNGTRFSVATLMQWPDGRWLIVDVLRAVPITHEMADGTNVIASNDMTYGAEEQPTIGRTVQIFRNF